MTTMIPSASRQRKSELLHQRIKKIQDFGNLYHHSACQYPILLKTLTPTPTLSNGARLVSTHWKIQNLCLDSVTVQYPYPCNVLV